MNSIDDERIQFYLKHRQLIDRWSQIADDLVERTEKFLWTLEGDIDELRGLLDEEVMIYRKDSNWPKLFLYRPSWWPQEKKGRPVAGIGVQWKAGKVDLQRRPPVAGVWTDKKTAVGAALSEQLRTYVKQSVELTERRSSSTWFPEKVRIIAEEQRYWEDLVPIRKVVVRQVTELWERYADRIDDLLERQAADQR